MTTEISSPLTNRQSTISLSFGLLTLLTLCMGVIPIPFTGFICFPIGFLSALVALISGAISLSQIQRRHESGRALAWTGIIIGGLTLIVSVCALIIAIGAFLLWHFHVRPFPINSPSNYQA